MQFMSGHATTFPSLIDRCWFLTGPTASGKSAVAMCLAERERVEILSLDSMAVYRKMDLGTAKPSAESQSLVPHHMLDMLDPDREFSVSEYLSAAHQAVQGIESRSAKPLFVGGTPMYLKGCLRGFDVGPPADWEFREAIEAEVEQHGMEALRARLQQVDPLSAHALHPNDKRRMIRALEVARGTGQPLSHRQLQFESQRSADTVNVYALQWPRDVLHQRIDDRVEQMFADGLVAEVESLLSTFDSLGRTALQAVGYKEVIDHLRDEIDLPETVEQVKAHTRQLARRQETWLRSMTEVTFIAMDSSRTPSAVVDEIINKRDSHDA